TGGQRYFPGWDHPPGVLAIKHRPHFLVLQVEKAIKPQVVPGQTPPKSQPDSSQPPVSVLMERDLGALRVPAGWITAGSALLFGVLVSQLHRRDKQAMARRAEGAGA